MKNDCKGIDLFDGLIGELRGLLAPYTDERQSTNVDSSDGVLWQSSPEQVILQRDTAFELGGGGLPAVSGILYTSDATLLQPSLISVYGRGLQQLFRSAETSEGQSGAVFPFAHIMLVGIDTKFTVEDFKLYNLLRSIEYLRYRISPWGFMPRISTVQNREQVRVAREAAKKGLDFQEAGRVYLDTYLHHPAVSAAELIFLTLPQQTFDYKTLAGIFDRAQELTMSLDHALNNLKMDCSACNLKPVCDEVETLCSEGRE